MPTEQDWAKFRVAAWDAVRKERKRQIKKWGHQRHSNLGWLAIAGEEYGEVARAVTELAARWLFEPSHARWRKRLRKELTQLTAVCIAWLEDMGADEAEMGE